MVILEEGNPSHPWFPLFEILVLWRSLNGSHKHTVQCKKGAEQKQRCLAVEEESTVTSRAFIAYGHTLGMVPSFKCLGIVLLVAVDDWEEVIRNLMNAWAFWSRMTRNLIRDGARPQLSGFFFKADVQLVLLFDA